MGNHKVMINKTEPYKETGPPKYLWDPGKGS